MKYEFKFISTDNYELKYTNKDKEEKTLPFKRTIMMASKIQGIQAIARLKMYKELTMMGMTKDDLIVKKKLENGTIQYDESNYRQFETEYTQIEAALIISEIFEDATQMSFNDFIIDIGLNPNSQDAKDIKQIELFTKKLVTIISGKDEEQSSPSSTNKE